jgi:hypothetical protein
MPISFKISPDPSQVVIIVLRHEIQMVASCRLPRDFDLGLAPLIDFRRGEKL